jgi:predicted dehydrogenase
MTVNAGAIPRDHWTQDPAVGGGRIVGEAVHWMDLARSLAGSPITDVQVRAARDRDGRPVDDVAHLAMSFADGSTAVIHYLATGSKRFPKERIEAFVDGRTMAIDNWRRWLGYGSGRAPWRPFAGQDKGHAAEVTAWLKAVKKGGPSTIPLEELEEVSRWAIRAAAAARGRS